MDKMLKKAIEGKRQFEMARKAQAEQADKVGAPFLFRFGERPSRWWDIGLGFSLGISVGCGLSVASHYFLPCGR